MLAKPIYDDIGPVGTLQAFPTADVTDVVMDFINQVKPNGLVQVEPLAAMRWRDVDRVVLPSQQRVDAFSPIDVRARRWELHQDTEHAPHHRNSKNWIVHQLVLPERVRLKLYELDRIKETDRGGMRTGPKKQLHVHMKHSGEIQEWKAELDMTVGYLVRAIALEEETQERDVPVMRGTHIPAMEECIVSYMSTVQVYLTEKMGQDGAMSKDSLRAGVLWQWSKERGYSMAKGDLAGPQRFAAHFRTTSLPSCAISPTLPLKACPFP